MDAWVGKYLRRHNYPYKIIYDEDMNQILSEVVGKGHDFSFYADEWNQVIVPNEVRSLDDYRQVSRIGRGTKIARENRETYWKQFQRVYDVLEAQKLRPFEMAVMDAAHMAENEPAFFGVR